MIKIIHLKAILYLLSYSLFIAPVFYGYSIENASEKPEDVSFIGEFTSIWDTTQSGTSANNEITIPTNPAYTYNYTVDWGDGSTDIGITGDMTHTYTAPGTYTVMISGNFPTIYFNNSRDRRKIIEILEWGIIEWQTMENAFYGCENLNFDAIDAPNLSQVTSLKNMFRGCDVFNGIVNNWDVSTITDLSGTFYGAEIFNRPLDNWNVINVTNMSETFRDAKLFNEPLDNWDVGNVTNMEGLFSGASVFNQNVNSWDVSQVTTMNNLFSRATAYNQPLNLWNVNNVTDMSRMFNSTSFNQNIINWVVGNVTDMSAMFAFTPFNQDISIWDISKVTDMSSMFRGATVFNQPIGNWNVSNVTNMSLMFSGANSNFTIFNQSIENWDVSSVINMSGMFSRSQFNQPLNNWDVSNVTDMSSMFAGSFSIKTTFNQPLDLWDTSSVVNMESMFASSIFNQAIATFNLEKVMIMSGMFFSNNEFNQPINNWNIGSTTELQGAFAQATSFNQSLDLWDTSNVVRMDNLFVGATSFNQNVANWNISNVTRMDNIFDNSGIDQANYDQILIGWGGQAVQSNITFGAATLTYCDGRLARQDLIDNFNWTIMGDTINCPFATCTTFASPTDGDINVPANFNLVWNASPDATGYNVTVTIDRGGTIISVLDDEDVANTVTIDFVDDFMPGDIVTALVVPYNADGPAAGCTSITFTVVSNWTNDPNAFIFTIDTSLAQDVDDRRLFAIQRNRGFTYDYSVDWGDGQFNNNVNADITHNYLVEGVYTISIVGTYPAHILDNSFRDSAQKLTSIEQWGTNKWQSMVDAFRNTRDFAINDPLPPDLSEVTNMQSMFESSRFNQNINNWDVSNVTNMARAFIGMSNYNQPLNDWDVSNVTTMSDMFLSTRNFNQPLDQWDVGNVTTMRRMFDGFNQDMAFNQNINTWDVSNVTDMETMFRRNVDFNQPLGDWDVSNVTNMFGMFSEASAFNQDINNWTPENVTDMTVMFRNATAFNQPLDNWNLNSLENMSFMFQSATSFNQDINIWNVNSVDNMSGVFNMATAFNQPLDNWDVTNVTNMTSMFESATAFNQDINTWDVNSLVNMTSMFKNATSFNQPLNNWDVSAVANMTSSFEGAIVFDQDISAWDVSSVTLMSSAFKDASVFNSLMNDWNVGSVTRFDNMFQNAVMFNQELSNWDTGEAQNMQEMFSGATSFNQNMNSWNVSFVATMEEMFRNATSYNQAMDSWNVASVTTMEGMFRDATAFNGNISSWNVRGVDTMESMFDGTTSFNQLLNNWRVSGVQNMDYMFRNATSYNQEMNMWNIGSVRMQSMFENAAAFDQFLGDWNISNVSNMLDMLDNTALSRENYDNTLISWSEQSLTPGINLGAETLLYCESIAERQSMIDTYGWIFTDDIRDCPIPVCTQLTSPENGDVDVPINTNLVWEPVLYATEYVLTITLQPSGTIINAIVTTESYEFAANELVGSTSVTVLIEPRNDEGVATGCVAETFSLSTNPATVPDCTILTAPLDGTSDIAIATDISWEAIPNADGYFLTVGTSTGGNDILNNEDVGNVTTYDLTNDLPEDTEIFVTLIPYNEEGNAAGCSEESFTTELIPVAPSCTAISEPLNGATNVAINTNLSWNSVDGATGYLVSVGTTQGGIEIANSIDVGNVTTYDFPADLIENRTFYVTIIPYNDVGDATGCAEESFTTETIATIPSCATLSVPLNGATDIPVNTDLSWNSISDATGYRLTVGTSSGGTDIINNQDVSNVTTFDLPTDLPESTEIFVSITPYNAIGDATGCSEESFTTEATTPIGRPFITTWQTTTANEEITIPTFGSETYNYNVNWGDGTTTTDETGDATHTYVTPGTYIVAISGIFPRIYFNTNGNPTPTDNSAKILTIEQWGNNSWTSMGKAFTGCINLTGNFSDTPDLSNVTSTRGMFATCRLFNSNINNWDMSNVIDIAFMFQNNISFNQPLNDWDVSSVTNMFILFQGAGIFNQPLDNWDVSNVTNLVSAFSFAPAFDQNIGNWNVEQVIDATNMFQGSTLSTTNYDALLIGWNAQNLQPNVVFSGGNSQYCEGEVARTNMISSDGWVITDDGIAGPTVDDLADQIQVGSYTLPTINGTQLTGNEAYFTETNGGGTRYEVGDTINFADFPSYPITIYIYDGAGSCTSEQNFLLTITTASVVPSCTSLSAPTNGTTNVGVGTDLSWNAVSDATGYRLTVGTSSGGSDIINNQDVGNVTTFDLPTDLPENTIIFVTIVPYNTIGDAIGCAEESFTTETVAMIPSCTTLSIPLDGATDISIGTDLSWNTVSDATGYRLIVGTSSGGSDIINNQDVGNVTNFDIPADLPENTEIFLTIIPYNGVGDATGCLEESFTTETVAMIPSCTTLSIPLDGATDISIDTDLSWNVVSGATGYRLTVGTSSSGSDIINNQDVGDVTTFDLPTDLPENTEIFVAIIPYNAVGDATGCSEESFTTENPIIAIEDDTKYGFSPDGDGINEFWEIDGIENYPGNTVSIYNRWGDMVFEVSGYNNTSRVFRGDANRLTNLGGGALPEGTYFFTINIPQSNSLKKLKGFLVLKR